MAPEKRRDVVVKTYLTARECEYLMLLARKNRVDVSDYMRHLLRKSIHQSIHSSTSSIASALSTPSSFPSPSE